VSRGHVDATVLAQLVADLGRDQVVALCGVFLDDAREGVNAVRAACDSGDADIVARTAHRLKSSCGFLGVDRMSEVCGDIERTARNHRLDLVAAQVDLVSAELELASAELASFVGAVAT
jgi:HPt (histidine-containing phosphotransfer) domain-containing protein